MVRDGNGCGSGGFSGYCDVSSIAVAPPLVGGVGEGKTVTSNITNIAKNLRKRSTDTERLLWRYLRIKQIEGLKFRR